MAMTMGIRSPQRTKLIEMLSKQPEGSTPKDQFAKSGRQHTTATEMSGEVAARLVDLTNRVTSYVATTYHAQKDALQRYQNEQLFPLYTELVQSGAEVKPLIAALHNEPATRQAWQTQLRAMFGKDTRRQQLALLTNQQPNHPAEKMARQNLRIALISVGLTGITALFPFTYPVTALCLIYMIRFLYHAAYRSLVHKGRINHYVISAFTLTAAILTGHLFAAVIGSWFAIFIAWLIIKTEDHSKQNLAALFGEWPQRAWLLVDGLEVEVPLAQVQAGQVVVVHAGQMIPIDGIICEGVASIDQQRLTGEAQPVEKSQGDKVLAATLLLGGKIHIQVEKAGQATVAAQIVQSLTDIIDFKHDLRSRAETFAERAALPLLALSIVTLPLWGVSSALSILWSMPTRMVMYGPLSMLSFLQIAAQRGILIKDGRSLELLHTVDTVVFDKTGTLTLEQPQVCALYCYNDCTETTLLRYAAAAEQRQPHPIARAIVQAAHERNLALPLLDDAHYQAGYGITVTLDGMVVQVGSERFMQMEAIAIPLAVQTQQAVSHQQGHSLVLVACDQALIGAIELSPTLRPEAQALMAALRQRHLTLMIISGDHGEPTRRLAEELGVDRYFAQVLPQDKAQLVKQLQQQGRKVCFVGDGINDALALKEAQVSVSLQGATAIAVDAAQVVLMESNLTHIDHLFTLAQRFDANMKVNFAAALLPSALIITGTLCFGWGLTAAVFLTQTTVPIAIYNTLRPLLNETRQPLLPATVG